MDFTGPEGGRGAALTARHARRRPARLDQLAPHLPLRPPTTPKSGSIPRATRRNCNARSGWYRLRQEPVISKEAPHRSRGWQFAWRRLRNLLSVTVRHVAALDSVGPRPWPRSADLAFPRPQVDFSVAPKCSAWAGCARRSLEMTSLCTQDSKVEPRHTVLGLSRSGARPGTPGGTARAASPSAECPCRGWTRRPSRRCRPPRPGAGGPRGR
jgi:hypothetical protein